MTNTSNDNVNQSMRTLLGMGQRATQPLGSPTAPQNAPLAAPAAQHGAQPDTSTQMRDLLHGGQQRPAADPGMVAFVEAAQRAKAKDPLGLYRRVQEKITVDLTGGVHGSMDDLVAELRRDDPSQFGRLVPNIDAGATGDAHAGGAGDVARLALAATRSGR